MTGRRPQAFFTATTVSAMKSARNPYRARTATARITREMTPTLCDGGR